MPTRRLPNSMPTALRILKLARDEYRLTTNPDDRAIGLGLYAHLDDTDPNSLLSRLLLAESQLNAALAAQAPLTGRLTEKAAQLALYASHFHQVLDFGITRGTFAEGARGFYGRPLGATALPDLSSYAALLEAGQKIVSGEAARAAAEAPTYDSGATYDSGLHYDGTHVPMALPSAEEVGEKVDEFKTVREQSQAAQAHTDRKQEKLQSMYVEANRVAVDICDTVEFFYRQDRSAPSRRAKCMRWGVVYLHADGTVVAPPAPAKKPEA